MATESDLYGKQYPLFFRGVKFYLTCTACPEQYDAWYEGVQIGYVRLRWGSLRANYLEVGGPVVFHHDFDEGLMGEFDDDEQRAYALINIAELLKEKHAKNTNRQAEAQG